MIRISRGQRGVDDEMINGFYASIGLPSPGGFRRRDEFLLARDGDGVLVATVMYILEAEFLPEWWEAVHPDDDWLHVAEIHVAPQMRWRGPGRALLNRAAHEAARAELDHLYAWPSPNPVSSHSGRVAFFRACGFDAVSVDAEHLVMVGTVDAAHAACGR